MSRGRYLPFDSQPCQESFHLGLAHFRRVTDAMESNERATPVHIRLLGAQAVVRRAHAFTNSIEQLWGAQGREVVAVHCLARLICCQVHYGHPRPLGAKQPRVACRANSTEAQSRQGCLYCRKNSTVWKKSRSPASAVATSAWRAEIRPRYADKRRCYAAALSA